MTVTVAPEAPPDPAVRYREALEAGRLTFQRCRACEQAWLPPRADCPQCGAPDWDWQGASGAATVVSWVVYHTAFEARFKDRLPYNVAVIQLSEGPRLISNLLGVATGSDPIGQPATLVFERDMERNLPRFRVS